MRDFPIAQFLGATTVESLSEALVAIFMHMNKLVSAHDSIATLYEGDTRRGGAKARQRIILLVEALSRELLERTVTILANQRVLFMPIADFRALVGAGDAREDDAEEDRGGEDANERLRADQHQHQRAVAKVRVVDAVADRHHRLEREEERAHEANVKVARVGAPEQVSAVVQEGV